MTYLFLLLGVDMDLLFLGRVDDEVPGLDGCAEVEGMTCLLSKVHSEEHGKVRVVLEEQRMNSEAILQYMETRTILPYLEEFVVGSKL
jgi:hypothetical protein